MAQATFKITLSETLILKVWISVKVKVARLCPILRDPVDYTIHEILQARIVEWVAFPFSRGIFPTQGSSPVSRIAGRFVTS